MILITGGSGSGKSAYAEAVMESIYHRSAKKGPMIYVATMRPFDEEGEKRIERHRRMRDGKGFLTVECYEKMERLALPEHSFVLLECLSNLLLNECGMGNLPDENAGQRIFSAVRKLDKQVEELVIVTNEIFSDGVEYDAYTKQYCCELAKLNAALASYSTTVVEVVYSIPVKVKGELPCIPS